MSLLKEFTDALDCCGTCAGGVLTRHMARAWDEGHRDVCIDCCCRPSVNPYRTPTTVPATAAGSHEGETA